MAGEVRRLVQGISRIHEVFLIHPSGFDGEYVDGGVRAYSIADSWFSDVLVYAHHLSVEVLSRAPYLVPIDIDIVHTHDWISSIPGRILSRSLGIPHVITVYSTETMRARSPSLLSMAIMDWERYLFTGADLVLAHNEEAMRHLGGYGVRAHLQDINDVPSLYENLVKQSTTSRTRR
jgi:hypothetical protein